MNTKNFNLNFDANDFAKSFGVDVGEFSDSLQNTINDLNFNYRLPSLEENESLVLEALQKIDSDEQIIGAKERDDVWFKGWDENLQMYINSGFDEKSLTPKFVRAGNPIRLNKKFVFPEDDNFELNYIEVYRQWYIEKYFNNAENIYEFGCGTGFNLLHVNRIFPNKKLFGSDFVQSSVDLVNEIGKQKNIELNGDLFNMLKPNYEYKVMPNSAIYTFGALEQLASNLDQILEYFISQDPTICIHTEPAIELYEDDSLVDYLGKKFQGNRGYSSGLITKLEKLEEKGLIEIIKIKRLYFGSYFMEGYNHIAWKLKK
jgi:hypothetical protein